MQTRNQKPRREIKPPRGFSTVVDDQGDFIAIFRNHLMAQAFARGYTYKNNVILEYYDPSQRRWVKTGQSYRPPHRRDYRDRH